MSPFKRAMLVWVILMGLFLLIVVAVTTYGGRVVKRVDSQTKVESGQAQQNAGRVGEAIRHFREAVAMAPKETAGRALLVETLLGVGRLDEALAEAEALVEVASGDDKLEALLLLGRVCRERAAWERAGDVYARAIAVAPGSGEAHAGRAAAAEALCDYGEMVDALGRVAECGASDSSDAYASEWERYAQKVSRAEGAPDAQEGSARDLYEFAMLYRKTGQWGRAVQTLQQAVGHENAPADAHFWLGVDAEARGDAPGAVEHYERVVARCPTHAKALRNLQRCLSP